MDTNTILIGDQVDYHLNVQFPGDYTLTWPILKDTLCQHVEIINQSLPDTSNLDNGWLQIDQHLTITSFDSGYFVLPPVRFNFTQTGTSNSRVVETDPYLLNVFSVAVDTTQAIKPIKGPIRAPYTFAELLPWLIAALVFLILVTGTVYYFKKRKQNEPVFKARTKPKLPPHKIALQELDKLKTQKLWQQGRIKDYHTRVTDIIRTYIEGKYKIHAAEMTSHEIMVAIKHTDVENDDKKKLKQMLELADLVKFAKFKPLATEHDQSLKGAYDFVQHTMIVKNNGAEVSSDPKLKMEATA